MCKGGGGSVSGKDNKVETVNTRVNSGDIVDGDHGFTLAHFGGYGGECGCVVRLRKAQTGGMGDGVVEQVWLIRATIRDTMTII